MITVRICIKTFGCTANRADSDAIAALARSKGHELVDVEADSEAIIINSCGVKDAAEKKALSMARALHGAGKKVVLCGCVPHINEKETRKLEDIGVEIAGLDHKRLVEILEAFGGKKDSKKCGDSGNDKSRTFTKPIARVPACSGCLSNCSFCATKLARGRLKSHSPAAVLGWVEEAVRSGAKEIQLTGQDIGCYGIDIDASLESLVRNIEKVDGSFRVRVGMMNPNYIDRISAAVRQMMASDRFYHFIHIPIQSRNDKVLKDMRRGYKAEIVTDFITDLRNEFGDSNITFWTDIIVGFPTEDEGAFKDSLDFVRDVKPDVVNISRFWPRPGTEAASLRQLPVAAVMERSALLAKVCKDIALERNSAHIGNSERVVVLERGDGMTLKGRNECYNQVVVKQCEGSGTGLALGDAVTARITAASATSLIGCGRPLKNV